MTELYHLPDETVGLIEEIQRMEGHMGPTADEAVIHRALSLYLATTYDIYDQSELREHDWTLLPLRDDEAKALEQRAGDVLDDILGEPIDVEETLEKR